MIGETFGRLTVTGLAHRDARWRKFYRCTCACGNEATVQATLLRSGNTRSCGCLRRELDANPPLLPEDRGIVRWLILQYRRHARDAGRPYSIPEEAFARLIKLPCHYCGITDGNSARTKNHRDPFPYNGLDRIDNLLGYTEDNVVPCCPICNRAKRTMTQREFLEWARRLAAHQRAMATQWGDLV